MYMVRMRLHYCCMFLGKRRTSYQYLTCVFLFFGFQKKHGNTDMIEDLKDSSVPTISKRFKTVYL